MLNGDYERDGAFESYTSKGMNVPAPPKPGELMICQWCLQPITPEQLKAEKNMGQRKRCFKWHVHPNCFISMNDQVDRSMPGLLTERKQRQDRAKR